MLIYRSGFLPLLILLSAAGDAAPRRSQELNSLPLAFEPSAGRPPQYLARGAGYRIALNPTGALLTLSGKSVGIHFAGASAAARPTPAELLPGKVNYFIGSDRSKWRTDIPTYSKVEYSGIYPGINVMYYGNQGRLEFDFVVQPGADASAIRLLLETPERPHLTKAGDLAAGEFLQHRPAAYQMNGPERTTVACRYRLRKGHEVALDLGPYDHARPLIIDPVLSYGTYVGGAGNDGVASVKVDARGNLYMAGFTSSANLPVKGAVQSSYAGTNSPLLQGQFGDAFVAKLNPSGTALLYMTYLGGSGDDFATSLAIDADGSAYVVGGTQSANFPVTSGAFQRTYKGFTNADNNGFYNPGDGWLAKLNSAGNQLDYSTYLGGALNDVALGVAVNAGGTAVVVGATESSDFPVTANAFAQHFRGNANSGPSVAGDAFVSVFNPAGTALTYSTFLGGHGHDAARGVAIDQLGLIYVCGVTFSSDFPTTAGALQTTFKGVETSSNFNSTSGHGFVTKLNQQGTLIYSTYLGGSFRDAASALAIDFVGGVYVTGGTLSTDFPTTANAPQRTFKGTGAFGTIGDSYGGDAFVAKLNVDGSALVYSTYLGGKGDEAGMDIATDIGGNAYVTGFTTSPEFPVTADALQSANAGLGGQGLAPNPSQGFDTERVRNTGDAFLVKMSITGALLYSSFYGGALDDTGVAVAVDNAGNPYIAGNTVSTALKVSGGALQTAYGGSGVQWPRGDGFVVKFDFGGVAPPGPLKLALQPGFNGVGAPGQTLPTPFIVQVIDANGAAVPGVLVSFTADTATLNPEFAVTDAKGFASTTVTLRSGAGHGFISASIANGAATGAGLSALTSGAGPIVKAIVNGASFTTNIAPGSWISVFTDQTANAAAVASSVPLPVILAGCQVLVNGSAIPIDAVTPLPGGGTQLNAQLPYEIAPGSAQASVNINGLFSNPVPFTVQASAPGIFVFGDNRAVVQNVAPDGSVTVNTADNPVPAGDFIIAYLTGQGQLDHPVPTGNIAPNTPLSIPLLPYSATLGGNPVNVAFLGMTPGQIALAQANIQIPRDLKPGTYPLMIKIGAAQSNGPVITATNPRP